MSTAFGVAAIALAVLGVALVTAFACGAPIWSLAASAASFVASVLCGGASMWTWRR